MRCHGVCSIAIVLIDKTSDGVNAKLEVMRQTLESKGFKLTKAKPKYLKCKSVRVHEAGMEMKWRLAYGDFYDKNVPLKLKGKFQKVAVRLALLYGKMQVKEMRILVWMYGNTRSDRIRNEDICDKVQMASIVDNVREARLRSFRHVKRKCSNTLVIRYERPDTRKGRGRLRKYWRE
ncbi:hypothetical protein H5410_052448, partial [Solanum commersonii]